MIGKNFFIKRLFSQNFLVKINIIEDSFLFEKEEEIIIEVGAGIGNITRYLSIIKAKYLFLVEIDVITKLFLNNIYYSKQTKIKIFWDDILYIDENNFCQSHYSIISNLPYNISRHLLIKWIYKTKKKYRLFLLLQKEFTEKILFLLKNEVFMLNIILRIFFFKSSLSLVSPKSFYPKPRVTSSMIKFINKINRIKYNHINRVLNIFFFLYQRRYKFLLQNCEINIVKFIILNILLN